MSKRKRISTVAGSGVLATVVAILVQLGSSAGASGSPTSTQTIDAKTDPSGAAQALNMCANGAQCKFTPVGQPTFALSAPRILGDALYNCGGAEAEDTVAISDERSQSTSLETSLSVKASVEILEVAKASIEAEVTNKQMDEVSTKTTQTNSVSVEPGEIGWTETQVPVATLTGTYSITNGGNQINVTNVALALPGFGDPTNKSLNQMTFTAKHEKMTDQDRKDRCSVLPPLNPAGIAAPGAPRPATSHTLVICGRGRGCANRRTVSGIDQPLTRGTRVSLVRGRVIYATGVIGKGGGVLRAQRPVRRGSYTLLLSGPHNTSMLSAKVR